MFEYNVWIYRLNMLQKSKSTVRSSRRNPVSSLDEELKKRPDSGLRPRIVSAVRIEQRLLNQQITYKRKLESLKKSLEIEQLKEIRSKPKISKKSRVLAKIAEKKIFEGYFSPSPDTKDSPLQESEKESEQVQPEFTARSIPKSHSKQLLFIDPVQKVKKRTKSLFHLSVLERNQIWLAEKNQKIDLKKKEIEEKTLVECTFSPTMESKLKYSKSLRDGPNSNNSYLSSPNSLELSELREQASRAAIRPLCRRIAPYQVKISFKCGIDLNSFLKRAK